MRRPLSPASRQRSRHEPDADCALGRGRSDAQGRGVAAAYRGRRRPRAARADPDQTPFTCARRSIASGSCTRWAPPASRTAAPCSSKCRLSGSGARRRSATPTSRASPRSTLRRPTSSCARRPRSTAARHRGDGPPLVAGDRLEIVYGAGPALARTDRYAERASRFWIAGRCAGDGCAGFLRDSPAIDVRASAPAALSSHFRASLAREAIASCSPSSRRARHGRGLRGRSGLRRPARRPRAARVGALRRQLRAAGARSRQWPRAGRLSRRGSPPRSAARRAATRCSSARRGRACWGRTCTATRTTPTDGGSRGLLRLRARRERPRVVALTDHDHWGILPLAQNSDLAGDPRTDAALPRARRFVTLLGFEWTNGSTAIATCSTSATTAQ